MIRRFQILVLSSLILLPAVTAPAQKKAAPVQQRGLGADKLLSLGDFYYRNNDITDVADRYYKQAIVSDPASQAAGYAQYNRGSYWFRKFYIVKEQYAKEDARALLEAEGQYYDFIDKYAERTKTTGLLSDAQFYLALVYLQRGKRDYAIGWLNRMAAEANNEDQVVHVYKVVWSSKPGDIVDRDVNAAQLATYTRQAIEKGGDTNAIILEIRRWCLRQ